MNEWMKAINVCIHNQYVLVCWRWAPSLDGFTLLSGAARTACELDR